MNTKSQLVVECYQLAFFVKIAFEKIRKISSGKKKNMNYTIIYGRKKQTQKIVSKSQKIVSKSQIIKFLHPI